MDELLRTIAPSFDAFLAGPLLYAALMALGLLIGVLTGLFGVGGGFLLNPLLIILLGINESIVIGSSLCVTLGTATAGMARHMRMGNVALRGMTVIGLGAVGGAVLGTSLHEALRDALGRDHFRLLVLWLYLALLLLTAYLTARRADRLHSGPSLLQRLPLGPRIHLPQAKLAQVSLPGLLAVGLLIGVATGLLGIGGGILFMPLLLVVVGMSAHQAIGTSLGVVVFSSVAGTIDHGLHGNVNLALAMALVVGSSVGVQVGAAVCSALEAARLRRWFALVVLAAACLVGGKLALVYLG